MLAMKNTKGKLRKQLIYSGIMKNKIGINVAKKVKDLHIENYKTLPEKIRKIKINIKNTLCLWIGKQYC